METATPSPKAPLGPGASVQQQAKAEDRARHVKPLEDSFPFFAGLSLIFGVLSAFCLYKNPCGITYPLLAACSCVIGVAACRKLGFPIKRDTWYLLAFVLLTGLSVCRTADAFLIRFNGAALLLLGCIFALHQVYNDSAWSIGKYLSSICLYLCCAVSALPFPFRHGKTCLKRQDNPWVKQLPLLLGGFLAALPVLAVLVALLGAADAIFSDLAARIFQGFLRPSVLFGISFRIVFASVSLYCLICSCLLGGISRENPDRKKAGPAAILPGLAMIAAVYVIFCLIQIIYLFLGRGTLPQGYTYSSYARQGFFQLLLVAVLNLAMVLCCLKYVRSHQAVKLFLTVICGCTYIMIASACCRMMLYVREYHLSYLRILVLWFLAMLAILMAGVTWLIWNCRFPLFRYSLAVILVFCLALSWSRPDSVIGWDYVNHLEGDTFSGSDFYYLYSLSADAAPALAHLVEHKRGDQTISQEELESSLEHYYDAKAFPYYEDLNLCNYNFSYAQAKKLFPGP